MQSQLPIIGKLQQQVQAIQEEMGSAQFQWDEERLRLAATQEQLTQDLTVVHANLQQVRPGLLHVHCFAEGEVIMGLWLLSSYKHHWSVCPFLSHVTILCALLLAFYLKLLLVPPVQLASVSPSQQSVVPCRLPPLGFKMIDLISQCINSSKEA